MKLSDRSIKARLNQPEATLASGLIVVRPFFPRSLQSCSIDLHLGRLVRLTDKGGQIDPMLGIRPVSELVEIPETGYVLDPGAVALASTLEWVEVPYDLTAVIEGKSSLARDFLLVECAGRVEPNWRGEFTVELKNLNQNTEIRLRRGMLICQISFDEMTTTAERPYGAEGLGSHYQGSRGPIASRLGEVPADRHASLAIIRDRDAEVVLS